MRQRHIIATREAEWVVPAVLLTLGSASFTLVMIPSYSGIVPALMLLPMWLAAAVAMAAMLVLIQTIQMMIAGVESPIARWLSIVSEQKGMLIFVALAMLLAGLNMITFMWIKPLLNYLIPFWADPYLASIDHRIFHTDPWRSLGWLNNEFTSIFYHRAWFALMIFVLLKVLSSPSSREKNAMMLTYFTLWSLFGPVVHAILPAAGPVFYARTGYGAAFAALQQPDATRQAADYLWRLYSGAKIGPASGISAMPSLHIATTVWIVMAAYLFARRWFWPVQAAGVLILLLSVSLGWHYAIDGIVGGAGTLIIYLLASKALALTSAEKHRSFFVRSATTAGIAESAE